MFVLIPEEYPKLKLIEPEYNLISCLTSLSFIEVKGG